MSKITKTIYVVDCAIAGHEPMTFQSWNEAVRYYRSLREDGLDATIDSYDCCE